MHQKALFLLALAKGVWALNATTANELTPLADQVLAGGSLDLLQAYAKPTDQKLAKSMHLASPLSSTGATGNAYRMGWFSDLDTWPAGSIAIIGVQGVILKSGMCGIGSMDRAERITEAANHPNVAAILLDIDTPGGQISGLATVHDAILAARESKPVVAVINDGGCYSAGYHTASACTEIWATHSTCGVGSIGVVCQFTDTTEQDKKEGRKRVAVYATLSTEKNKSHAQALAGDTAALVAELDILNDDFHARIKAQRGAKLSDPAAVFAGQTYNATEGVRLGLIDTIGSMQQALARCSELASSPKVPAAGSARLDTVALNVQLAAPAPAASTDPLTISIPTPPMKKFARIAALMGVDASAFVTDAQGAHLNLATLEAIENDLATGAVAATDLATATTERNTAQQALATAQAGQVTANTTILDLQARLLTAPAGTNAAKAGQETPPANSEGAAATGDFNDVDAAAAADLAAQRARFAL